MTGDHWESNVAKARRIAACLLAIYLLGLAWGYIRLPFAAIKALRDYDGLIVGAPAITLRHVRDLSPIQQWYLKQSIQESPVPVVPAVSVEVEWNAWIVARVSSEHFVSPTGAERRECLYFCFFGAWIPLYDFGSSMA